MANRLILMLDELSKLTSKKPSIKEYYPIEDRAKQLMQRILKMGSRYRVVRVFVLYQPEDQFVPIRKMFHFTDLTDDEIHTLLNAAKLGKVLTIKIEELKTGLY